MQNHTINWLLALAGGLLLALMIDYNSLMAKHSTPVFASWVAHGIGAITCFIFVTGFSKFSHTPHSQKKAPLWSYLGGLPGALTVVLAAITVNSTLGLSGSLAFMLVGQIFFGLICDLFGLFGNLKRRLVWMDLLVVLCVLTGSAILIFLKVKS